MILHLFSEQPPKGRCLILAQKLAQISGSGDAVRIAESLFAFRHTRANPAVLPVLSQEVVNEVVGICAEYGITVEVKGTD